jgi:hypothetical protein
MIFHKFYLYSRTVRSKCKNNWRIYSHLPHSQFKTYFNTFLKVTEDKKSDFIIKEKNI